MSNKSISTKNVGWILSENVVNMFFSILITSIVSRYLGPENKGILDYSVSYVGIWSCLADLGLASIVQKEETLGKARTNVLLGTSTFLCLIGGGLTCVGVITSMLAFKEGTIIIACSCLISISYIFKSYYTIKYVLNARLQSKIYVKINFFVQIAISVVKIILVFIQANIYLFAACFIFEALLQCFLYRVYYMMKIDKVNWRVSYELAKQLLKQGFPNILSSLAVIIYSRSDQVMLGKMANHEIVGLYSAATNISEMGWVIPTAIATSMLPVLIEKYKIGEDFFRREYIKYIEKMLLISCFIAVGIWLIAKLIIKIIYGDLYMGALKVARIYVFTQPLVAIGLAEGAFINIFKLQKITMYSTIFAAFVNIILNCLFIPHLGGDGAALATLIAMLCQVSTVLFGGSKVKELRGYFFKAICFNNSINQVKIVYREFMKRIFR